MIRFNIDGEKARITHSDTPDWHSLVHRLTWYNPEGTIKLAQRGDFARVSFGAKSQRRGMVGSFRELHSPKYTLVFQDGGTEEFHVKHLTRVERERQIFKDEQGYFILKGVVNLLKESGHFLIEIENPEPETYGRATVEKGLLNGITEMDFQMSAVQKILSRRRGLISIPTSGGKCHGKGTKIVMFDGTVKTVENILEGDLLMGADSTPRQVTSTCVGQGELFKIVPRKGESWVCNADHILSLKHTETKAIRNISVKEWFELSDYAKHCLKLYRTGVDFPEQEIDFDPYMAGLWLGDGSRHNPVVTNSDPEIIEYMKNFSSENNLKIREVVGSNTTMFHFSRQERKNLKGRRNPVCVMVDEFLDGEDKKIPNRYKINSRENRLKLLAGIIDTDGYLHPSSYYEVTCKSDLLREDILFLARSLGFSAHSKDKYVQLKGWDSPKKYNRISIGGDTSQIPCLVKRKKSTKVVVKDALCTGFSVEPLGVGDYYGFEITGDHLYLLWDFTVTHNTVCMGSTLANMDKQGLLNRAIIIVPSIALADQAAESFRAWGISGVGVLHGTEKDVVGKKVVVAVLNSVISGIRNKNQDICDLIKDATIVLFDEAHHLRCDTCVEIMSHLGHVPYVIGVSGSPFASTEPFKVAGDVLMYGMTGGIIFSVDYGFLKETGLISEPIIFMKQLSGAMSKVDVHYSKIYKQYIETNEERNNSIEKYTRDFVKHGHKVLILASRLGHAQDLLLRLKDLRTVCVFGGGKGLIYEEEAGGVVSRGIDYDTIRSDFELGKYEVMIGSTVLDEGFNLPSVGAMIMAAAGRSRIKATQRLGRAIRKKKNGDNRVYILDFIDRGHVYLHSQSRARADLYKEARCTFVKDEYQFMNLVATHNHGFNELHSN